MQNCNPSLRILRILQTFRLYAHTRFRMLKRTVAVVELYEKARIIRQGFWVKIRISLIRSVRNLFTLSTKQQSIGIGNSSKSYIVHNIWVSRSHLIESENIWAFRISYVRRVIAKKALKLFIIQHGPHTDDFDFRKKVYSRSRFILSNKQPHARCTNVRYMST